MDPSTTDADNPTNNDAPAESTTVTDPQASTDTNQPGESQQPDPSKSDSDAASDDDKSKETDKPEDAPASFDDDIDEWISKRGLPKPESDEQKQAYQDMRNSQREFTREQQAKKDSSALGDAIKDTEKEIVDGDEEDDEDDPLEKRLSAVEKERDNERTTRLQSEFYITNKVSDAEHKAILEIFKEKVNRPETEVGKREALALWSKPDSLSDLLELAKARIANSTDVSTVKDEAAREEREKIAQESQAKSPSRSATTTSTDDKSAAEQRTEALKARYSSNK